MPIGGTSYQPTAQPMDPQGGMRRALTPQEAVRILSLRLPKNPQNFPVPQQLLTSAGGGATSSLTQLLQALMQAQSGATGSRELVSDFGPEPTVDPVFRGARAYTPPRVVIGDQGRVPVSEPPVMPTEEPSPLYDAGIPTMRVSPRKPMMSFDEPLF